jgi:hypothetical protein
MAGSNARSRFTQISLSRERALKNLRGEGISKPSTKRGQRILRRSAVSAGWRQPPMGCGSSSAQPSRISPGKCRENLEEHLDRVTDCDLHQRVGPDQTNSPACGVPLDATLAVRAPGVPRQRATQTPARSATHRTTAFEITLSSAPMPDGRGFAAPAESHARNDRGTCAHTPRWCPGIQSPRKDSRPGLTSQSTISRHGSASCSSSGSGRARALFVRGPFEVVVQPTPPVLNRPRRASGGLGDGRDSSLGEIADGQNLENWDQLCDLC